MQNVRKINVNKTEYEGNKTAGAHIKQNSAQGVIIINMTTNASTVIRANKSNNKKFTLWSRKRGAIASGKQSYSNYTTTCDKHNDENEL